MRVERDGRWVVDQMGRSVRVPVLPRRIVSLVPSQTELLFELGVGERVVGVTRYCVHPAAEVSKKEVVGGTKTLRFDIIERLKPDLVIGNMEENERGAVERLAVDYPVWISDVRDLGGALRMIRDVGELVGTAGAAEAIALDIETAFAGVPQLPRTLRVAYVIWRKPYMVAGRPTFIDAMLTLCGFENAFGDEPSVDEPSEGEPFGGEPFGGEVPTVEASLGREVGSARYPSVTESQFRGAELDLMLLASEPFPFDDVYRAEIEKWLPGVDVRLVDGEMFSWYGSRLAQAADYLGGFVADVAKGFQRGVN